MNEKNNFLSCLNKFLSFVVVYKIYNKKLRNDNIYIGNDKSSVS